MSKTQKAQDVRRKVLVFSALAGSLTLTAVLLQLLSPAPLRAQADFSVLAAESPEVITKAIAKPSNRAWKYIYIHHSKTADGDAQTIAGGDLGDHFVICNGRRGSDGEVQVGYRWTKQLAAKPPKGANKLREDCISICMIGDFDHTRPTVAQMRRLSLLVNTLQTEHGIEGSSVFLVGDVASPAGIGRHFPVQEFRQQIITNP